MVLPPNLFRADPRIARRTKLGAELQAQALRPIQASSANPYGFNPLGQAAQRLAAALGSNIVTSSAEQREAEQRAAQGQVLAQLLKVGSARPNQLIQTQVPMPGPDYALTQTQYSIANDGTEIPTLDPAIMKTAGLDPAMYQVALAAAKTKGDKLTQAGLEKQIKTRLGEIGTMLSTDPNNSQLLAETEQLRALLVPEDVAKETVSEQRSIETENRKSAASREKELRKLRETTQVVIDKRPDSPTFGQPISITKQQLLDDIESAQQGNPRAFGAPQGLKVGKGGRLVSTDPFDQGKKSREELARGRLETAFKISNAVRFVDTLNELPRLSGLFGKASEVVGGVLGQLPIIGKDLENAIAKRWTGGTPEQRANFVQGARRIIQSMIAEMTGEESSRISKSELDITESALPLINLDASPDQIIGAVRSAVRSYVVYLAKADLALANNRLPLDNKEAITPYIKQLGSLGFDANEIANIMFDIKVAYRLLPDLTNKKGAN
tara:strand:+ start:1057 stop:2544 length:1488 start_codon:yes stop_codon:yes gene_type:complete